MKVISSTNIQEYPLYSKGKVRDIYELDEEHLLIITTDRMSAFDVVMPNPIPYKGVVLNQITIFWMEKFSSLVDNHLVETEVSRFPAKLQKYGEELEGRSVIVKKAKPLPIECIVRGYITGSGWKDYQNTGKVCGHVLPDNLKKSDKLPNPLFTPSTKAELGEHDENITIAQAKAKIGEGLFKLVEDISLKIYTQAQEYARSRGIIIADTKFEFGLKDKKLLLIDEVLTPDSSRFWPAESYTPGKDQPSFDKQYLRDWLTQSGWDKTPPAPNLPEEVIEKTKEKYLKAYELLTGKSLF
ncbi:MAG TPA: phosphoribosylaminoimidazolesuccinocarboxamide synthase [Desulfonauticus sp.]|jgi:phosphoribosylaminoimidazole-succinocarboxamide synthase|nr:MAG: Phosphoribosylaminoimidazole-succinocarboxamide synthase [Desulfonauticus sp. 38_4375]MDK2921442.1 phosphoribosylaminoimidazole-succinocarboxamide synthase [Desulfonauticus sp.]HCO11787.1 phosphoribosylaminoimidazolesuccinocarboxamide synthase [Desulfonauticus sp.]